MRRAGTRLRTIASRLCGTRTMERLVDPTLADLQAEYEHAVGSLMRAPSGHVLSTPLAKGANELTLSELRQLIEPGTHEPKPFALPSSVQSLSLNYHGRWAMAVAPLVLALFALALSSRRERGQIVRPLAGCLAIVGYFVIMQAAKGLGRDLTLTAFAAAWIPNIAFLILSAAIMKRTSQRELAVRDC